MITRIAASLLALSLVAGCYGTEILVADASLEVLVTGARPGDRVKLVLDGVASDPIVVTPSTPDPLSFSARLAPGEHEGELELARRGERFCEAFSVETPANGVERVAIDLRSVSRCDEDDDDGGEPDEDAGEPDEDAGEPDEDGGEPDEDGGEPDEDGGEPNDDAGAPNDDAGASNPDAGEPAPVRRLESVEERVVQIAGCENDCETRTDIEDELRLTVSGAQSFEGSISSTDFAALELAFLDDDADRLFEGDDPGCPVATPPEDEQRVLRRVVVVTTGTDEHRTTESVNISGCSGVAATLRARIAVLREEVEQGLDAGD